MAYQIRLGRVYEFDRFYQILSRTRPYRNYRYFAEKDIARSEKETGFLPNPLAATAVRRALRTLHIECK